MDATIRIAGNKYMQVEEVAYPNGGTSSFFTCNNILVIVDHNIYQSTKAEVFPYSLITDVQNRYVARFDRVYRFLYEDIQNIIEVSDEKTINEFTTLCGGTGLFNNNDLNIDLNKIDFTVRHVGNRADSGEVSPLEIQFESNFSQVYGSNAMKYLSREYGISDIDGNNYFLDYFVNTTKGSIAVEENGITYHHPQIIGKERYRKQLKKQNTCADWGIKLFRFSSEDCRFQERIEDDIQRYFGDSADFIENGVLAERKFKLYEHQKAYLEEISKSRHAGINSFLVVMPTATGKSKIIETDLCEFAKTHPDFRALIMAPNTNIIDDWNQRIQESLPEYSSQITIKS